MVQRVESAPGPATTGAELTRRLRQTEGQPDQKGIISAGPVQATNDAIRVFLGLVARGSAAGPGTRSIDSGAELGPSDTSVPAGSLGSHRLRVAGFAAAPGIDAAAARNIFPI